MKQASPSPAPAYQPVSAPAWKFHWQLAASVTMKITVLLCLLWAGGVQASTAVFSHGEGGYPCIRIPSVASCGGLLHAFAECRTRIGDGCIPAQPASNPGVEAGICYKKSSDDGVTWSRLSLVASGGTQPTVVCERQSQTLLLQFNAASSNWQTISTNSGKSWSPPVTIDLGNHNNTSVGPGRGLQLSDHAPAPGRILFIGHHGAYQYDVVWYSDDGGKSYSLSETVLTKMDEAQLVEVGERGDILANMRNSHLTSCECRATATSNDGGKSFGPISYDPTLVSPVCMATILSTANGSLVFANPASKDSRERGLIRRSDNGGQSWPFSWPVSNGSFAYSCLTHVSDGSEVGLLWETSAEGCSGPSCQMVFSKYKIM